MIISLTCKMFWKYILFIIVNLQSPMILKILMLRIGLPKKKKNMRIILIWGDNSQISNFWYAYNLMVCYFFKYKFKNSYDFKNMKLRIGLPNKVFEDKY